MYTLSKHASMNRATPMMSSCHMKRNHGITLRCLKQEVLILEDMSIYEMIRLGLVISVTCVQSAFCQCRCQGQCGEAVGPVQERLKSRPLSVECQA